MPRLRRLKPVATLEAAQQGLAGTGGNQGGEKPPSVPRQDQKPEIGMLRIGRQPAARPRRTFWILDLVAVTYQDQDTATWNRSEKASRAKNKRQTISRRKREVHEPAESSPLLLMTFIPHSRELRYPTSSLSPDRGEDVVECGNVFCASRSASCSRLPAPLAATSRLLMTSAPIGSHCPCSDRPPQEDPFGADPNGC